MSELRNILLLVIGLFVLSMMAGCQEPKKKQSAELTPEKSPVNTKVSEPETIQGKPVIKIAKPILDFGKLNPNDKKDGLFEFTNTGDTTLKIARITKTCGCTNAVIITKNADGKTKMDYEPGENGTIKVEYTATIRPGPASQSVTIYSNAANTPVAVCRLKATVELAVNATPEKLTLSLVEENAGIPPITVKSKDDQEFKIVSFSSSKNAIQADFDPNTSAKEFVLYPKVNMETLKSNIYGGIISIGLTHPKVQTIHVSYNYKSLWETTPSQLLIHNIEQGEAVQRDLLIKSNYGKKVEIDSVTSKKKLIEVVSTKETDKNVHMVVKIKSSPDDTNAPWLKDTLEIGLKSGDTINVDCVIYFRKKPANNSK